tara:strand:+ start:30095 stop:30508 length:414 start_codon:yes stop_codon:yes gene_type:complete
MTEEIPDQTRAAWDGLPAELLDRLMQLRRLILDVASTDPAIGAIEEVLKWGQPAFLTSTTGSGTTVRIHRHRKSAGQYAFYVHCQTDLVERYRQLYSDQLAFEGNRAVVFDVKDALPVDAVRHCLAMALTYHLQNGS